VQRARSIVDQHGNPPGREGVRHTVVLSSRGEICDFSGWRQIRDQRRYEGRERIEVLGLVFSTVADREDISPSRSAGLAGASRS
jgi:hypothetical protein